MRKCSDRGSEGWLLTQQQRSEVQGINQEQIAAWQVQSVHEKWVGCVLKWTPLKTWQIYLLLFIGVNLPYFLGMARGPCSFFEVGHPDLLQAEVLEVLLAVRCQGRSGMVFQGAEWPQWYLQILNIFWFLAMKKQEPSSGVKSFQYSCAQISFYARFYFILEVSCFVLELWMYCISKHYNPTYSEQKCFRRGREQHAKFIFQAFPSADLRYVRGR